MSTASDVLKGLEIGGEIAKWVAGIVARYIAGEDSEPVRRVVDILPKKMRADVEHARQREMMRQQLEAAGLGERPTEPAAPIVASGKRPTLADIESIRRMIARPDVLEPRTIAAMNAVLDEEAARLPANPFPDAESE